jgi:16S rRNA (uracil1498-N3)-methyltransferase
VNLILFEAAELDGRGRLVLDDRRGHHVCRVLRASPGDRVRLGMVHGGLGIGEVIAIGGDRVELAVTLTEGAPPRPSVDLILAVPRPKILPRVLQAASALGAGRIDLINAWRVDKSYLDAHYLEPAVLAHHARLGCEQGGSTWVPDVTVHRLLMPFVHELGARRRAASGGTPEANIDATPDANIDATPDANIDTGPTAKIDANIDAKSDPGNDGALALIAHPRAAAPIETAVLPGSQRRVLLAVGPEGGWIEREIETFLELGFLAISSMDRVLRVETAVSALMAQIALLRRLG